jgi:hypothetical protein
MTPAALTLLVAHIRRKGRAKPRAVVERAVIETDVVEINADVA